MIEVAILAGTAVIAWVLLTAPVRTNFVVLVLVLALVPPVARVPNGFTSQLLITRVLVIVALLGLAIRVHRGEAPGARFGRHPLFVIVAIALAIALVNGVMFAKDVDTIPDAFQRWLLLLDQALVLLVITALLRAIDDLLWAAKVIALAFGAAALIGLYEARTGTRVIAGIFGSVSPILSRGLTVRGGFLRPRGTFEFAQEFGLVLAFVAPVALVWALQQKRHRLFGVVVTSLIVLVSMLTISRSAVISLAVAAVVLTLVSRSGAVRALALTGIVLALIATSVFPNWWAAYSGPDVTGSTQARIDRIPVVTSLVADHAWTGVGLFGIEADVPATDNQYLLTYAELGAIGAAAMIAMWFATAVSIGWGLRGPRGPDRMILAGCLAGVVAGLVAAGTIDLYTLGGSRVFWLLAGLGLVAAERTARPVTRTAVDRVRRFARPVLLAAGAGVALGVVAVLVYPRSSAQEFVFTSWPNLAAARDQGSGFHIGSVYVNSVCEHTGTLQTADNGVEVSCRGLEKSSGVGVLRIAAPDRAALDQAVHDERSIANVLTGFELFSVGPPHDALPNPVRTAPLWLAVAFAFVVSIPRLRPSLAPALV